MEDITKDSFYAQELKRVYNEYLGIIKEINELTEQKNHKVRLIKNLLGVLKLMYGDHKAMELLERFELKGVMKEFFALTTVHTAGKPTVFRRRSGEIQPVQPATVYKKGTRIRMLTGNFAGMEGYITSHQVTEKKEGGMDILYYFSLSDEKGGRRKRTSAKQNSIGKTFEILES